MNRYTSLLAKLVAIVAHLIKQTFSNLDTLVFKLQKPFRSDVHDVLALTCRLNDLDSKWHL